MTTDPPATLQPPLIFLGQPEPDMASRCRWVYEVCGGLLVCALTRGHNGPWHGNTGPTWSHAWREDDEDAYELEKL